MNSSAFSLGRVEVVDSHTAGEPTRVILSGGPELGPGDVQTRLQTLRTQHDSFRSSVIREPRGSEVVVGALLFEPAGPSATAAVIFFNDVGYLGMCGHGTIGVVATLAHLGRIAPGKHSFETPVGLVQTHLHDDGSVSVENVASYRHRADVPVDVPGYGRFHGDISWGGNWFFLVSEHSFELELANRSQLVAVSIAIRAALAAHGITGKNQELIDHIELCGPPQEKGNSGRNFVLCPGASFDRSPCGTGTSAKMACLYAAGELAPETPWRQEGILGTVFEGHIRVLGGDCVLPTITGRAWITAESTLLFDSSDPFRAGVVF